MYYLQVVFNNLFKASCKLTFYKKLLIFIIFRVKLLTYMFIWNQLSSNFTVIIEAAVILVVYLLLLFVFLKVSHRNTNFIVLGISFASVVVCFIFNLSLALIIVSAISAVAFAIILLANIGDLRGWIAAPFKKKKGKKDSRVRKLYDRDALIEEIEGALKDLSKRKIGAIITFEKNTSLDDISKNGVKINAPVTKELLETIFYPGTRLHDGAVVIKENYVSDAAVFFTPSTKPFANKYGSRHRAAIGVSEVSDSVTVVVSEETGRISIAYNGEIESVSLENFKRVFDNYMSPNVK